MKTRILFSLVVLGFTLPSLAQDEIKYFQRSTPEIQESIALWVSGDYAGGSEFAGTEGAHSAFGPLTGVVRPDGLIHVTWNYQIEGSHQSEEQLLKLDGDTLYLGEGELQEHGPGQLVLKDPGAVVFEKALQRVPMSEPALDSAEAEPAVTAIRDIVGKLAGAPVELSGGLRLTRGWARFTGYLETAQGATPSDESFASRMGDEFQIYLKQGDNGWQLVRHGFRSPEGYFELEDASTDEYETAPWPLDEELLP